MVAQLLSQRLGGLQPLAVLVLFALAGALLARRWTRRDGAVAREMDARRGQSLLTDLGYLALSPLVEACSRVITTLAMVACVVWAGGRAHPGLMEGFGPVIEQPRWLVVLEMLFIGDFFYYWAHRLAHTWPLLWRVHAVHHSSRHLRWTSALRVHPAETYVQLCHQLPLFLAQASSIFGDDQFADRFALHDQGAHVASGPGRRILFLLPLQRRDRAATVSKSKAVACRAVSLPPLPQLAA